MTRAAWHWVGWKLRVSRFSRAGGYGVGQCETGGVAVTEREGSGGGAKNLARLDSWWGWMTTGVHNDG